jgi:hypothetical protein
MPIRIVNKKRFAIMLVFFFALIATVAFSIFKFFLEDKKNKVEENPAVVWEAMIQTKGQDKYENEEDRKTYFENGDVMVIFPAGHPWSSGEKGETIIKLKIKKEEADKLMESVTEEKGEDGEKKPERETVRLRKYRIDLDEIDLEKPDKIYDEGVIEEK